MTNRPILSNGAAAPEPSCWAPCAEVPVHPRAGRLWANVRPVGAETAVPSYPLDALYDQATLDAAVAAAVAAAFERCAKLCEPSNFDRPDDLTEYAKVKAECVARIRETASGITPAVKG